MNKFIEIATDNNFKFKKIVNIDHISIVNYPTQNQSETASSPGFGLWEVHFCLLDYRSWEMAIFISKNGALEFYNNLKGNMQC